MAPEPPRVTCRITPVADICRDRPLSDGAFTGGSNWFKRQLATNSKELKPAQVRGLSEPGFRRHWSVSVTHRFLRRGKFRPWAITAFNRSISAYFGGGLERTEVSVSLCNESPQSERDNRIMISELVIGVKRILHHRRRFS